ncbi:uncharacterized protein BX664DRAFT_72684 [Halteromyces radiatus]|uniref:uncharacterized protein n=1 Tax=Halteromyces radiatus TaxID=101107 RepID=UPI00221E9209|nr:uncharacterized protein BX664DRAFT_72684 [Halteromyces radiatus]KAI8097090.1 hypothetical protein BX664DRAFT_72684 [Halteromyces radiatus]
MPIPIPLHNDFYSLLNHSPRDKIFHSILQQQNLNTIKRFPDSIYHAYKSLGLSFCFVSKSKPIQQCDDYDDNLILDAIDIYNGVTKDGYQPYSLKLDLPYIDSSMVAHDIVSLLGEPDRKGGGGQTRLPCWIEYKFEKNSGGMMIQLHGLDWDDSKMGWTSIVLYR